MNKLLSGSRFAVLSAFLFCVSLYSYDPDHTSADNKLPKEIELLKPVNEIGQKVNLDLEFLDEKGTPVRLKDVFSKGKPVIISMVYYKCPTLCNFHLSTVLNTFKGLDWAVGDKFEYLAVSFDPKETFEVASPKRDAFFDEYQKTVKNSSKEGWHFWTGTEQNSEVLAAQLGFRYSWSEKNKQWMHPSVMYILTPEGKISQYFQGLDLKVRDIRFALIEASSGKVGNFVDKFVLFCYQFDPGQNKYVIYAHNIMRLGAVLTVLLLGVYIFTFWKSTQKKSDFQSTGGV